MADPQHLQRRLRALAAMKLFLEDATTDAVLSARAAGLKSESIGESLGISYQAVQRAWPADLSRNGDRKRHRRRGEFSLRTLDAVDRTYIGQAALDLYVAALQPQQLWPWTTAIREHLSLELKRRRSESSPEPSTTLFAITDLGITVRCVEPSMTGEREANRPVGGEVVLTDAVHEDVSRRLLPTPDLSNADPDDSILVWQRRIRAFVTSSIADILSAREGRRSKPNVTAMKSSEPFASTDGEDLFSRQLELGE